ncbi:RluA family pseudouridine synthase [Pirellulimonas nuda]|uniref:RluA family pseudouridine synthase n=1 Tax=Pirellulimonas nuda TaxID=2528009 RepID=UPI00119E6B5E|nr:RNA pseudouridine synthase [Pirellulimonas nuda]
MLFEDNHLLAVNKPAGLPTMGVAEDRPSLLAEARAYIKAKYDKPGKVYLGIVSRLDAPVTGVVLLARTSKAAGRLCEAFRSRTVGKHYLAIVAGDPEPSGRLEHHLRKDERHRRVHTTSEKATGAQLAVLDYEVAARGNGLAALRVTLQTGRKHQIRVQLAAAGWPIVGDRKYGSDRPLAAGIALHAYRLDIDHPVRHEPLELSVAPPTSWRGLLGAMKPRLILLGDLPCGVDNC